MKIPQVILLVAGIFLVTLISTNPSIEDHRQALLDEINKNIYDSLLDNILEQSGREAGLDLGQGIADKVVSRSNYLIFSFTEITIGDKSVSAGIGIFGQVFIKSFNDIKSSISNTSKTSAFDNLFSSDSKESKVKINEISLNDINTLEKAPPPPPSPSDKGEQVIEVKIDYGEIFDEVEIEASFPGGDSKWRKYIARNLNHQVAIDNGAQEGTYTTVIQFVVGKEGDISDVRPLTNHGYGMEDEAMRVIKRGPKWNPAIRGNVHVKAYRKQPVTFRVELN